MEEQGSKKSKPYVWIVAMVVVAVISFVISMFIFREIGYEEGIQFAVSSSSKQGYSLGFDMGYQLRDSLAKKERELRASNQFNLNLIEQEAGRPEDYILLSGSVVENISKRGLEKVVSIRIVSAAHFARYKEMVLAVKYLGKRNKVLGEQTVTPDDILYPGTTVVYDINQKDVPDFTESVDIKLVSASGVD